MNRALLLLTISTAISLVLPPGENGASAKGSDKAIVSTVSARSELGESIEHVNSVAFGADGSAFVLARSPARVIVLTQDGVYARVIDLSTERGDVPACQFPYDLAVDGKERIFISDAGTHRIFVVNLDGTRSVLAGTGTPGFTDGPGSKARFNRPAGLTLGIEGNLLIADSGNHRIRQIDSKGVASTVAGVGTAGLEDGEPLKARFSTPIDVCSDSANRRLYVADSGNHCVRQIDGDNVVTLAGNGQPGRADGWGITAQFNIPAGLVSAGTAGLFVADRENHRVVHIASDGTVRTVCGGRKAGARDGKGQKAEFNQPGNLSIAPDGSVWLVDSGNDALWWIQFPALAIHVGTPSVGPEPTASTTPETEHAAGTTHAPPGTGSEEPTPVLHIIVGSNPSWVPVGKSSVITAIVTTERKRPVPEITVTFTVELGSGRLAERKQSGQTKTDSAGVAQMELLEVSLGVNRVRVTAPNAEPETITITGGVE